MFNNYFAAAMHNLLKNKLFSIINIVGLSIGLAACILIALFVLDETSYDEHWENAQRIYRLNTAIDSRGGGFTTFPRTSGAVLPALKEYFLDEIELSSRMISTTEDVYIGESHFEEPVITVGSDFIDMFQFEVVAGDLEAALADPGRIALRREVAERFFGGEEAIGRIITVRYQGSSRDYVVSAVYRQPAPNSVLDVPMMRLVDEAVLPPVYFGWTSLTQETYLQLKPGVDPGRLSSRLPAFTDRNVDISGLGAGPDVKPSERYVLELQNITDLHLHSPFDNTRAVGNPTVVLAFSAIAVLVLAIACINFTILSTAKATERAREVAMRKVVGADRCQLMTQYLGESLLLVLPALLLALAMVELLLPSFEAMVGKRLGISLLAPHTWVSLSIMLFAVTLLGGLYPACVLSHFRPASTLKANQSIEIKGAASLCKALMVFQFGVVIALMVATSVIYAQVQYGINRDPGFDKDNLVVIDRFGSRENVYPRKDIFKRRITALPEVTDASFSSYQPGQQLGMATALFPYAVAGSAGAVPTIATVFIDADFFRTYRIPIIAGRDYSEERDQPSIPAPQQNAQPETQPVTGIIINASAARQLGFADPADAIGRQITGSIGVALSFSIIGVAADTHFFSLNAVPRAEVYVLRPGATDVLTLRYQGDAQSALADIAEVWTSIMGDAELSTGFVDRNMVREFEQAQEEAHLLLGFSLLAIVIACLGLYGSASITVEKRTKEIGIRKVMGAEVEEIMRLLMWQFSKPVLLANVIAWPTALWAMLTWLQRFPYQIDTLLLIPLCVLASAIALSIAWLTVAGKTVRVANTKPVLVLRYE